MSERIVSVAISAFGFIASLPAPARHGDVLKKLSYVNPTILGPGTQGFITSAGRFVNRRDAAVIALEQLQVEKLISPPELYSEDLW